MFGRQQFLRTLAACCLSFCCLIGSAVAGPRDKPEEAPAEGKGYTISYSVVTLGIVLGLLGVCRPRNRDQHPKLDATE